MKRSAPAPNIGPQFGWWDTANIFFFMSNFLILRPAGQWRLNRKESSEATYRPFPAGEVDQGTSV